jgi:diguanylate cyclase (GGDEF)-like protein
MCDQQAQDRESLPGRYGVTGWLLSGIGGMLVAVTLVLALDAPRRTPLLAAGLAVVSGAVVMVLLAPWRCVVAWRQDRDAMERLADQVRRFSAGATEGLQVPEDGRDDLVGRLTRAIRECLLLVVTNRRAAQRLERAMSESIRRETRRQTLRLQREARTDPLTGLSNRRALDGLFQRLREERPREQTIVAMAVDLDRFKEVNDRLGHETGDRCLTFLGELLRSSIRRGDHAVRVGGDEFILLMPNQSLAGAEQVARRLCSLFRQMPWIHPGVARPTLSVGLASTTIGELDDGRPLLRDADNALYQAKRSGRARVTVHA